MQSLINILENIPVLAKMRKRKIFIKGSIEENIRWYVVWSKDKKLLIGCQNLITKDFVKKEYELIYQPRFGFDDLDMINIDKILDDVIEQCKELEK